MARIAPTDRSMPPAMMISVMPSAMMLMTAVCRTTLERFVLVRKCGEAIARPTNKTVRVRNGKQPLNHVVCSCPFSYRAKPRGA